MRNPGHDSRDLNGVINAATADCADVIEFGCMFGDRLAAIDPGLDRAGIDAHLPYIEEARRRHPDIVFNHAEAVLASRVGAVFSSYDAVLLIDFLEHLTRDDAREVLDNCKRFAKRIVLFVPLGSHPQTRDVFEMGADHWQTHRSTWEPADLTALGFDVAVWDGYHLQPGKDDRAAFCIWEPCRIPPSK